jgi:hypothetical protein
MIGVDAFVCADIQRKRTGVEENGQQIEFDIRARFESLCPPRNV